MSPEPTALASAPVTVVTGANSGIGRAVAIHLAGQGHRVYGTVRSFDRAAKLTAMAGKADVEVNLVELDVADDDSVRAGFARVFDRAGRVDVLVNNAGVGGNATVDETPIDTYAEVINVDLYGQLRCLKAVLPSMRQRRRGTVINVTSVVGRIAALAQGPYVASKWALEGVSEQLAQEVARFGIRVAIIEPGLTKRIRSSSGIARRNDDHQGLRSSQRGLHVKPARVEGSARRPVWRRRPQSRLERIGHMPIFRHLPAASLRQLLPFVDDAQVAAGTVILNRGSQLRHLYVVAEGTAGTIGPTGDFHFYEPGQPVGLDELFSGAFIS
jgi:NAD(P)-dependent dehydrogenase (short-subunit alcohol dehydrogenase family)